MILFLGQTMGTTALGQHIFRRMRTSFDNTPMRHALFAERSRVTLTADQTVANSVYQDQATNVGTLLNLFHEGDIERAANFISEFGVREISAPAGSSLSVRLAYEDNYVALNRSYESLRIILGDRLTELSLRAQRAGNTSEVSRLDSLRLSMYSSH